MIDWKKIWGDSVWSKVIASGITALLGIFYVWIITPIKLGNIRDEFLKFITGIPASSKWMLFISAIFILTITTIKISLTIKNKLTVPNWYDFKEDTFEHMVWKWEYRNHKPANFTMHCTVCDYELLPQELCDEFFGILSVGYFCDSCGSKTCIIVDTHEQLESKFKRLVELKIRDGTWRQIVELQKDVHRKRRLRKLFRPWLALRRYWRRTR